MEPPARLVRASAWLARGHQRILSLTVQVFTNQETCRLVQLGAVQWSAAKPKLDVVAEARFDCSRPPVVAITHGFLTPCRRRFSTTTRQDSATTRPPSTRAPRVRFTTRPESSAASPRSSAIRRLVGPPRFELGTSSTPRKRATRLRHGPTPFLSLARISSNFDLAASRGLTLC